jgi:hypothetical protein
MAKGFSETKKSATRKTFFMRLILERISLCGVECRRASERALIEPVERIEPLERVAWFEGE